MRYRWLVIGLLFPLLLSAQTGTRFWFAVPYLTPQHDNSQAPEHSKLCFTTYDRPATIVISQPGVTDPGDWHWFPPYTLTLGANATADVLLSDIGIHRAEHKKKVPYGLLIEADENISVYFAQTNANSEIYTLKGDNALGTDFVAGMQNSLPTSHAGIASIEILATEDNTVVDILTPVPSANDPNSTTIQVTLNRGEVYTVAAKSSSAADHLSGTVIHASQPVAVNSTDDSVAASGQDLAGDQLVPDRLAGTEYIAVKNSGQLENLYIYALQDNTSYSLNGVAQPVLHTRQTRVCALTGTVTYIQADRPLVVYQLTGVGGELGATQLPKMECTGSSTVVYKARFAARPQVAVLVHSDYADYFTVNGSAATLRASDFTPVPGAADWSYCIKELAPQAGTGLLKIHNDSTVFHAGVLDWGGGGTCTYGYFSDYNTEQLSATNGKPYYIEGEALQLQLEEAERYTDIVWTFADGTVVRGATVTIPAELSHAGYVEVSAKSKSGCELVQDSRQIALHVLREESRDSLICEGEEETVTRTVERYGFNLLNTTGVRVTCTAPPQQIWKAVTETEAGLLYEFRAELSVENTNRKPNLQVAVNGETAGTVPAIGLGTTPAVYPFRWTGTRGGRTEITLHTTAGTVSGAVLRMENLSFAPVCPVTETVHVTVDEKVCDEPGPGPDPEPEPDPDPEPEPEPALEVEVLTTEVTLCDGDERLEVAYRVTEGEAHVMTLRGETVPVDGSGTAETDYHGGPCDTVWQVVFTDTVNHISTGPQKIAVHVYYSPLKVFTQKWGNTLAAYTGAYSGYGLMLRDFQWWQDGAALPGENKSYLYRQEGLTAGAAYVLTAVYTDERGRTRTMRTCPYIPEEGQQPASERIYTVSGMAVEKIPAPGVYLVIEGENKKLVIQP